MQAPYGNLPQQQAPPATPAPKRYDGKNGNPVYDSTHGGHYGASAGIAAQGHQPRPLMGRARPACPRAGRARFPAAQYVASPPSARRAARWPSSSTYAVLSDPIQVYVGPPPEPGSVAADR